MNDFILDAEKKLTSCLGSIPFVSIVDLKQGKNPTEDIDLFVKLQVADTFQKLAVEVKKKAEPRLVRDAVNQMLRHLGEHSDTYGIIMAPFISKASAAICKQAGMGYIDLSGNCFLSFANIHIEKEGNANPFAEKRALRSIFYPKAERILRVLLNQPGVCWKMQTLADEACVSLGQTYKVKKQLEDWSFIETSDQGFCVFNWRELLQTWSQVYTYRKNKIYDFYSFDSVEQFEKKLDDYCRDAGVRYALTLFSGADKIAPFTRMNRFFAYVQRNPSEIQDRLNLKPVSSGASVTLLVPYDEGVFYNPKENIQNLVSPIQLYLDLHSFGGRGEDAAEFLYNQKIERLWSRNMSLILKE